MKVKLMDIIDAMEDSNIDISAFVDKKTGEIVYFDDNIMTQEEMEELDEMLEEHGCARIPDKFEINDYNIMASFVQSRSDTEYKRLSRAIIGKGAFRRFKDGVYRLGIEKEWYEWRDNTYKRRAIEWCEENGLEYE